MDLGISALVPLTTSAMHAVAAVSPAAVMTAGMEATSTVAKDLTLVKQPLDATARGLSGKVGSTTLERFSGFLGKALPPLVVGASAITGAHVLANGGPSALIHTQQGRAAVLGTIGGSLLLVPTPLTQLGGAAVLGTSAVNSLGLMDGLNRR